MSECVCVCERERKRVWASECVRQSVNVCVREVAEKCGFTMTEQQIITVLHERESYAYTKLALAIRNSRSKTLPHSRTPFSICCTQTFLDYTLCNLSCPLHNNVHNYFKDQNLPRNRFFTSLSCRLLLSKSTTSVRPIRPDVTVMVDWALKHLSVCLPMYLSI